MRSGGRSGWPTQFKNGEVKGAQTPVGIIPAKEELNIDGLDIDPADLDTLLTIDTQRWKQEIWAAHRRVAQALDEQQDCPNRT